MLRWLIPLLLILLLEFYSFQAFKAVFKSKWILGIYVLISVVVLVYISYFFLNYNRGEGQNSQSLFTIGLFLITFVPKVFLTLVLLGEDIYRLFSGIITYFLGNSDIIGFVKWYQHHVASGQSDFTTQSRPFCRDRLFEYLH